ncbi:pentatricopeptide repeat-containing protein At1g26460, mitochondrial [Nicotiana tomentosiformis]|uniref:pentatricopeptide repeat-containing protein At1g26460, mitochondrial n=1 Tax=Nicotiana tomentosiformis TaxID=4098 RepID=UPI00051B5D51|nr:pentatricopeptide repeat-containing protein At1g26460, mitochondrial [Nicotiana tomentosiformis]
MTLLTRSRPLIRTLTNYRSITTVPFLSQEPQLAGTPPEVNTTPLPPNPSSGSPLYNENWRSPFASTIPSSSSVVPLPFLRQSPAARIQAISQTLDVQGLMNLFADWMTTQRWEDMKQLFELWIRSLDRNGKPNKPDANLFNHYLRANLMMGATADDLLGLASQMEEYGLVANTASHNLILKAMYQSGEPLSWVDKAVKLLERMIQTGKEYKEALPDDESYDLVMGLLFKADLIDDALKYVDSALKSGYKLSMNVFNECVRSCVFNNRLDILVSIIEKCKKTDQNKGLLPPWNMCTHLADVALQADNNELAFSSLEFFVKWVVRGESVRPPVSLSVDEGLLVAALGTAGRTYNAKLLNGAWEVLKRSLRQMRAPNPESFLAKIYAHASLGQLQNAFATLHEFEKAYGSSKEESAELFSPFTTLNPLAVACCRNGFVTLDSVYYQLENLSRADPPYKSVAALNCVILGCANIWDIDRAYQTFAAIESSFGLVPDIHSYNALIYAFAKLGKRDEATKVYEHFMDLGVKPNEMTYSLLVDAHLIKREPKAAISVVDEMVHAQYKPSKEMLKKIRRRCTREMDYESDDLVEDLAKKFNIRLGTENRRNMLFDLQYSTEYAG